MKLSAATRATIAVATTGLTLAALVGCSSASTNDSGRVDQGKGSAKVTQPAGTSNVVTVSTPDGIPSDLHFTVGRNDSFVSSEDKAAGARGAVVSVTNTSDKAIKIYSSASFGDEAARSTSDDSIPNGTLSEDSLPKECGPAMVASNQARFATGGSTESSTVTIDAGKTYFGCGIVGLAALPKGESSLKIEVGQVVGDDQYDGKTVTVDTGDSFN